MILAATADVLLRLLEDADNIDTAVTALRREHLDAATLSRRVSRALQHAEDVPRYTAAVATALCQRLGLNPTKLPGLPHEPAERGNGEGALPWPHVDEHRAVIKYGSKEAKYGRRDRGFKLLAVLAREPGRFWTYEELNKEVPPKNTATKPVTVRQHLTLVRHRLKTIGLSELAKRIRSSQMDVTIRDKP